jgi:hypothetical protein
MLSMFWDGASIYTLTNMFSMFCKIEVAWLSTVQYVVAFFSLVSRYFHIIMEIGKERYVN